MKLLVLLLALANLPAGATTICYDGKSLASDSQMTEGGYKDLRYRKLFRINGDLVGCAGNIADAVKFREWYADRSKPKPLLKSLSALVVTKTGCYEYDENWNRTKLAVPCAVGSGKYLAIGALEAGASAKRAVEIAARHDLNTGGMTQVMTFESETLPPVLITPNVAEDWIK